MGNAIDALEQRVRALLQTRNELSWRIVRVEATTLLLKLRNQYAAERRAFLAESGEGEPTKTSDDLRRVRELIEQIDRHIQTLA